MMIAIRQSTTFNTGKFPNPILHRFAHGVLVLQVEKTGGVGPVRETIAKGLELTGNEGKRRGRHCTGTRRGAAQPEARRCTGYVIPTKQRVLLRLSVARSPPAALRRQMPAALHSQCHAMRALKTSKPSMFAASDFQHFLCYTREEGQPIPCKI